LRRHLIPGPYYQNIHPDADVLSEPRPDAVLLGRLAADTRVEIVESTSDWVRIVFKGANGRRSLGWVVRSYIVPRSETPTAAPIPTASADTKPTPPPSITMATVTPEPTANGGGRIDFPAESSTPLETIKPEPTAAPALTPRPTPMETDGAQEFADFVIPDGAHSVTLNAPNPEKPTRMTSRPDAYSMSYGDYYNGVMGEYISYDPLGYVRVRVGTTVGYLPAAYVWIDAPRGMIPSAIPSARVAQMGTRLNMRSHPNTQAEILAQFLTDQPLEVLAIRDDWMQVRVDGMIGYVASAYAVKMVNRYVDPNTIPINPIFNGNFSDYAEAAGSAGRTISPVSSTLVATPTPAPDHGGQSAATPLTPAGVAAPSVSGIADTMRPPDPPESVPPYAVVNPADLSRLPMLEYPNDGARVLCSYNKGVIVTIDAVYDAFYLRVHVGSTYGYMALASLDTLNVPSGAPDVFDDSLPRRTISRALDSRRALHAAPSTYADQLGSCSPGQTVVVLGVTNAWSHVSASGRIGYIRSEDLE
ncbi:MAG: SH3 domain-containing protein, partial [Oscillospiraceae bacterium]|nr:SH3 domain-containing protein [Oscillospiraceae bacterium]